MDEEAAAVVRRIFRLAVEVHVLYEISKILTAEKVEYPAGYLVRNGRSPRKNTVDMSRPYDWYGFTVSTMLTKSEYMRYTVNRCLELGGYAERIDHRSHAAHGPEECPTIHEGVAAQALERRGIISDHCKLNRQIKSGNAPLRELKAEVKSWLLWLPTLCLSWLKNWRSYAARF